MRVSKDSAQSPSIHLCIQPRRVGILARRGQLLLAVAALSARDTEAVDDTVARGELGHSRADGLNHTDELVAEDIPLFCLRDDAVQEVHIAAAHGSAGYLDDHVVVVYDSGLGDFDCFFFKLQRWSELD